MITMKAIDVNDKPIPILKQLGEVYDWYLFISILNIIFLCLVTNQNIKLPYV